MEKLERRKLALLHEILARLTEDEDAADYHRQRVTVLEEGFTAEYDDEFVNLRDELAEDECRLLWEILDMFRAVEASYERLSAEEQAQFSKYEQHQLLFQGFDFNRPREYRMVAYMRFLVATDRWTEFARHLGPDRDNGNSHAEMLPHYQQMLEAFNVLKQQRLNLFELDVDALRRLLPS